MDALIRHALALAQLAEPHRYLPIKNRIAYVVSHGKSFASNGYAIRTHEVAKALQSEGIEAVCCVIPGRPWELDSDAEVAIQDVIDGVRYLHAPWQDGIPKNSKHRLERSIEIMVEQFKLLRPSAVLAASNYLAGLPAMIAAKRLGIPFYNEVRGFWEWSRVADDVSYRDSQGFQQEIERNTLVAQHADKVFTLNQAMAKELATRGVDKNRIELIPNGVAVMPERVEPDSELRQRLHIQPDEQVVGYIGSVVGYEGLDTLIAACKALIQQGQRLKLVLVGDYHEVASDEPWLIRTGRVAHNEIGRYYALLDAVVIPRKNLEVCQLVPPLKVVEALVYGKRVIVSDVAALREYADQYEQVTSFAAENVDSLVDALKTSLKSAEPAAVALDMRSHIQPLVQSLTPWQPSALEFFRRAGKAEKITLAPSSFQTAQNLFYQQGNLHEANRILDYLVAKRGKLVSRQQAFHEQIKGLIRLQNGISIPPRQPNPGYLVRRKQLLYCLHQSVPHTTNGYSTRSHGIAVGLQQSGWKVSATTRTGFPWDVSIQAQGKGYHYEEVDGITYTACAGWRLNDTPLDRYIAEAADHFLREAQSCSAEVIVAASNHITALPALIAARRLGLPFVYEVRGLWEVTQASVQPEWMNSDRYHLMKQLEALTAREADLVITLTAELADELVVRGTPRERIKVVPNAVDDRRFSPREATNEICNALQLKPNIPVIGYAGSAVAYEGLELLLDALAVLKRQGIDFYFVLVGDGQVIDVVKEKAEALKIASRCRFTGRIPFRQVPDYLACMDILPIPRLSSAVTEMVSPLKPLEAMAMGKAVLLSDVSPHQVFAGHNERARLFKKDSVASLAENLRMLIENPQERQRLGQAARQWIMRERTWKRVTHYYSSCIDQLLQEETERRREAPVCGRTLPQIRIGLIADQFTTDTLASAVHVVTLSPAGWQDELAQQPIDALFVESAWKGNDGQWLKQVGYYSDEEFAALQALLAHCRSQGIPTLFWNKEDPVHFDRFRRAASLCDHVFTTDSRRIIPYLSTPESHTKTASSCPFYASPKIHNLLPSTREWQHTAAYGGTYYGQRYPERSEYMDKIMSATAALGLTIYDRQHNDPDSPYKYPGALGRYVAGSLSYEDMIQAYKAHPLQINVNSVLDSPTMFSRRVVEAAACGAPIISGPALGMNRYLDHAGFVVADESQAAEAAENLLANAAYRWRIGLKGARAIMRAHTTELRLVQMLRTAGMVIRAPQPPALSLMTEEVTRKGMQQILAQSIRPQAVYAQRWQMGTQAQLRSEGIACHEGLPAQVTSGWWLLAQPQALEALETEDMEDLMWPTLYAPQQRIAFIRDSELAPQQWPGVAIVTDTVDTTLQLLQVSHDQPRTSWLANAQQRPALALRKPSAEHEQVPPRQPKKTVVIAGHDLKFIKPFYPYFRAADIRVLLDFWTGHNQHNEQTSRRLLKQADTVFCEWMLGNAIWYGKHRQPGQTLVGRLHAQELRTPLFDEIPWPTFDTVSFVGPHMLRKAQQRAPALRLNGRVIYNGVDVKALKAVARQETNGKVLGLVGMVPQSKGFDQALDLLRDLRQQDPSYILRVKGKRPEDFPWMLHRKEEMAWYHAQYQRLEDDELLRDAVFFDAHGDDMPVWYAGIDFVLSVSEHESFHLAVAEGAAAGCTPIVLPWEGASELYPNDWVYPDLAAACAGVQAGKKDPRRLSEYVNARFNLDAIAEQIVGMTL